MDKRDLDQLKECKEAIENARLQIVFLEDQYGCSFFKMSNRLDEIETYLMILNEKIDEYIEEES